MLLAGVTVFTSCSKDDDPEPTPAKTQYDVTTNIKANTTWKSGKVYTLKGRIAVEAGATLTIEPGTIVKGDAGTGANATALLVARGGKLMAQGTASQPIIFTSTADNIQPGQIQSPNLTEDQNGFWGGVIICGRARISASNSSGDVDEVQIEGIPTSDPNGLYGGSDDADNSGVLTYVSIRHGGSNIGSGNEINGLTLGGVGSGTTIQNVEIVANQDDGIEWFGGTVNVTNAISWNVGDDGMDTDQSWGGTLSNFAVITPAGHCFELDGPEGSYEATHTIEKGAIITSGVDINGDDYASEDLINVDDNSLVNLDMLNFTDVVSGQQINRVTAAGVTFSAITIDVPADSLANHVNGAVPAGVTAGNSPKADLSVFNGWSWASAAGVL